MKKSVLSAQLDILMQELGLKQRELATVMGVGTDRVKNLLRGRALNLTREEGEKLIRSLNVRAEWLATGEGSIFRSDSEKELQRRLDVIGASTAKALLPGLSKEAQARVQMILTGLELGNADLIRNALEQLSDREQTLLANYRGSTEAGRRAVETTASAFAHGSDAKKKGGI